MFERLRIRTTTPQSSPSRPRPGSRVSTASGWWWQSCTSKTPKHRTRRFGMSFAVSHLQESKLVFLRLEWSIRKMMVVWWWWWWWWWLWWWRRLQQLTITMKVMMAMNLEITGVTTARAVSMPIASEQNNDWDWEIALWISMCSIFFCHIVLYMKQ